MDDINLLLGEFVASYGQAGTLASDQKRKQILAAFDALRGDCPHASQTRYVGCGGMAYWICDGCERVVGKKHRYIDGQEKAMALTDV